MRGQARKEEVSRGDIGEEEVKGRESKDEKINKDGKKLISWIGERG